MLEGLRWKTYSVELTVRFASSEVLREEDSRQAGTPPLETSHSLSTSIALKILDSGFLLSFML